MEQGRAGQGVAAGHRVGERIQTMQMACLGHRYWANGALRLRTHISVWFGNESKHVK